MAEEEKSKDQKFAYVAWETSQRLWGLKKCSTFFVHQLKTVLILFSILRHPKVIKSTVDLTKGIVSSDDRVNLIINLQGN